jgi:hypothetical protein
MIDAKERFTKLRNQTEALRLYALVDGPHYYYAYRGMRLTRQLAFYSLFEGAPDAALAHAGYWLVDAEQAGGSFVDDLAALEQCAQSWWPSGSGTPPVQPV